MFDLAFLLAVVATIVVAVSVVVAWVTGRGARARKIAVGYGLGALAYLVCALAVSYFAPQRTIALGEPWCFDDWCMAVNSVTRAAAVPPTEDVVRVDLRFFSEARGVSQRAKGAWIYVIDERGRRYAPESHASDVALDSELAPGQSVTTARTFRIPTDVRELSVITGHGGTYCGVMSVLIIGQAGCVFHKPTKIPIAPTRDAKTVSKTAADAAKETAR